MHEPLYRQALRHSWQLAWQHKFLWIFGLFAALLGQMGLLDLLSKVWLASSDYTLYPHWLAWPKLFQFASLNSTGFNISADNLVWLVYLLLVVLGAGLFLIFTSVVSQGAIIKAAAHSAKTRFFFPSISQAWSSGVKHFWRLLLLNVLRKLIMVILAVVVGYGSLNFVISEGLGSALLFLGIFILAAAVGAVVSFLLIYAGSYIVVEDYRLVEALSGAWKLFTDHWLVSIEVGLTVLLLNVGLAVAVIFGFLFLFFPTLLIWAIAVWYANYTLWLLGAGFGITLFLLFVFLAGSVFSVYTTSVWTYLFVKMHKVGVKSRIIHWLGH
jgi:hypothetical protein